MSAAQTRDASQIGAVNLLVNAGFQRLEAFLESKVTLLGIGALPGSEPRTILRQW